MPKQQAYHNGNRMNCIAASALAAQKRKQQRQPFRAAFVMNFFSSSARRVWLAVLNRLPVQSDTKGEGWHDDRLILEELWSLRSDGRASPDSVSEVDHSESTSKV